MGMRSTHIHTQFLHVDIEYVVSGVNVGGEGSQHSTRQLLCYNANLEIDTSTVIKSKR